MKFKSRIVDHVYLAWTKKDGFIAVALDDCLFPVLDLTEIKIKPTLTLPLDRHYIGYMFCNFLKNRISEQSLIDDYWLNQFLEKKESHEYMLQDSYVLYE